MARQGRCSDSTPDALTAADRLAGTTEVFPTPPIEEALSDASRSGQRACKLSHRVMLRMALATGVITELTICRIGGCARIRRVASRRKTRLERPTEAPRTPGAPAEPILIGLRPADVKKKGFQVPPRLTSKTRGPYANTIGHPFPGRVGSRPNRSTDTIHQDRTSFTTAQRQGARS